MTVIADTSVLIDHLRGNVRARRLLVDEARAGRRVAASVMTKVEVLAGTRPGEETKIRRLLARLQWIPVDEAIADRAGDLARQHQRAYPGVDPVDYVIAATVQLLQAELWTLNLKHFPMFPSLSKPY